MNKMLSIPLDRLEDIQARMNGCRALVDALYEIAGTSTISEEALRGISDLLEVICRDFQADIDRAEVKSEKEGAA